MKTPSEVKEQLKEHVAKSADAINEYLEIAKVQAELTKDFVEACVNESKPAGVKYCRGHVVEISANKGSPEDTQARIHTACKLNDVAYVAFNPTALKIYVVTKS